MLLIFIRFLFCVVFFVLIVFILCLVSIVDLTFFYINKIGKICYGNICLNENNLRFSNNNIIGGIIFKTNA